jgi:hypothetical protein
MISCPAESTSVSPSDKAAAPEINLGQLFGILCAQVVQQRRDTLMIALDCCVLPMQLQETGQDLKRSNRHVRAPFFMNATQEASGI